MNTLLIFFALPVATIIISIALQKIFKNPALVAAIIFAIFLVVTFVVGNLNFLVATIAYTILSYLTALLTCFITRLLRQLFENNEEENNNCCHNHIRNCCNNNENSNNTDNDLININNNNNVNGISARINVIPNTVNNGNTGQISGCYRRR